jgi:hypothetical protein
MNHLYFAFREIGSLFFSLYFSLSRDLKIVFDFEIILLVDTVLNFKSK